MEVTLTLEYEFSRDDDDFGWLAAKIESPRLRATGGFWVQWQDIEEWAATLTRYPIADGGPLEADWGQSEDGVYRPIVAIGLSAANRTGHLDAAVTVADHNEPRHVVRTVFRTTYAEVSRFAADLAAMMRRELPDATLSGRYS